MLWCWMDPKKEALPQEEAVSVFCTCPFIHLLSPQKGRRAQGEWACCGLYHLCLAAPGSKPVTLGLRDPRCQGLRGGCSGCKLGQGIGFYPRVPPSPGEGAPPLPGEESLPLGNISCFPPLSLETWGKWDLGHQGPTLSSWHNTYLTVVGISQGFGPSEVS